MKMRFVLALFFVLAISGCKTPPHAELTDDTIVTSEVDGVTLTHRHAVIPPQTFHTINAEYRALYSASVMSTPGYGGSVIRTLENGQTYSVLGQVENDWLAVAAKGDEEMLGYVLPNAVVKSDLYEKTLKQDRPRPRRAAAKKPTCVSVDNNSKACQRANSGTWVIE